MKKFNICIVLLCYFLTSCGLILYPERRGNSHGRIDPAIAVLDGVGLLFFIIPGLVAFTVDFATGCIYLGGNSKSRFAYSQKIMLDKNKDMMMQVNDILGAQYKTSMNNAIMLSETYQSFSYQ